MFATCLIFYCKLLMADENQLYVQLFERWVSYIYGNVPDLGHVNRDNSLILLLSQMGYIGSVFVITMSWRLAVGFHTVIDKECPRVLRMAVYVSLSDSLQTLVDIKSLKKNVGCHSEASRRLIFNFFLLALTVLIFCLDYWCCICNLWMG